MIQDVKIKNSDMPILMDDCIAFKIIFNDKKLVFYFLDEDLSFENKQKGLMNLKISFVLSENFLDEKFAPAVRQIDRNKIIKKRLLKYLTLKEFVSFIAKRQYKLKFYANYYNENKCLLIFELMKNDVLHKGIEFDVELIVDKIIFEWT